MSNVIPSAGFPSIYDRLNAAKIDWAYYFSDLPFLGLLPGIDTTKFKHFNNQFFNDANAGTLPPVVMIDPAFSLNDDHPPHHPLLGEQFISSVYNALATSPQWKNILFVVTYDEHGGFFDHVSPPQVPDDRADQGFNQLGFRVPTLVIGPYVKKGYVSSVQHDHTSVVKHIEKMFGLEPLTMRDAAANDLSDAIDADRLARGQPAGPVTLPVVMVDQSMLDPLCLGSDFKRSDIELHADAGGFPPEMDLRGQVRDLAFAVGDRLQAWGAGGIRRGR
jgi:phospholipase C